MASLLRQSRGVLDHASDGLRAPQRVERAGDLLLDVLRLTLPAARARGGALGPQARALGVVLLDRALQLPMCGRLLLARQTGDEVER